VQEEQHKHACNMTLPLSLSPSISVNRFLIFAPRFLYMRFREENHQTSENEIRIIISTFYQPKPLPCYSTTMRMGMRARNAGRENKKTDAVSWEAADEQGFTEVD